MKKSDRLKLLLDKIDSIMKQCIIDTGHPIQEGSGTIQCEGKPYLFAWYLGQYKILNDLIENDEF